VTERRALEHDRRSAPANKTRNSSRDSLVSMRGFDSAYRSREHQKLRRRPTAYPAPVGSDVSSGTYKCTNCGYELGVQSLQSLPPCRKCNGPQQCESRAAASVPRAPTRRASRRRRRRLAAMPVNGLPTFWSASLKATFWSRPRSLGPGVLRIARLVAPTRRVRV
jgi:hypothetical protein